MIAWRSLSKYSFQRRRKQHQPRFNENTVNVEGNNNTEAGTATESLAGRGQEYMVNSPPEETLKLAEMNNFQNVPKDVKSTRHILPMVVEPVKVSADLMSTVANNIAWQ
ncbi:hypothetical protein BGZ98_010147 [Dissophora globulifera]|nr:hypothetical protein BGZ98_010147 [Dissophora globulifera]